MSTVNIALMQKETTCHSVNVQWRDAEFTVSINLDGFVASDYYGTNLNLTGYANWFGSQNICHMLGECAESLFLGCSRVNLLELGSGLGRAGIMAAKILEACEVPSTVVLTDGAEEMVPLLFENCVANGCASMDTRQLLWGQNAGLDELRDQYRDGFDVIIGADLLYGGKQGDIVCDDLLCTVSCLLAQSDNRPAAFYLAFTRREHITLETIDEVAKKYNLSMSVCENYTLDIFENNVETDSMFWRDTILMFVRI